MYHSQYGDLILSPREIDGISNADWRKAVRGWDAAKAGREARSRSRWYLRGMECRKRFPHLPIAVALRKWSRLPPAGC